MSSLVYLGLGSNLGERAANLQAAVRAMPPKVRPLAQSPVYETPPWGYTDQPRFLNLVVQAETDLAPLKLLDFLKNLELEIGRTPSFRYGPRQIDLDILFYDDLVLQTPELCIPHPRLHERAFVLVPLADLAPHLCHPGLGQTVAEMLSNVDASGIQKFEDRVNLKT